MKDDPALPEFDEQTLKAMILLSDLALELFHSLPDDGVVSLSEESVSKRLQVPVFIAAAVLELALRLGFIQEVVN